jgi:dipeptidyl-peptidase-4
MTGTGSDALPVDALPPDALPRQLARTRRFSLGLPAGATVSPDGRTVFFLRSRAGDDPVGCLWAVDRVTGAERLLADPVSLLGGAAEQLTAAERTRRERTREMSAGIVGFAADRNCGLLAFALSGQLWVARPAEGSVRRLPVQEPAGDPRPDPGGRAVGYLSGGAVRVVDAAGPGDRLIAAPDGPAVSFGRPEHVAAESMGRYRGYWWSPDGRHMLIARVDEAAVRQWYRADPAEPGQPPTAFRYPPAGSANAAVSLWVADLSGPAGAPLTPVDWDTAGFEYLAAAGWDESGPFAAVQRRDQRHVQVLGIEAATGATTVLAEQRDDKWVQLVPGLPARTPSGVLLTHADTGGTRRLVADGRPLTPPGLQLDEVLAVDGETVLFTASEEPTQTHVWACHPEAGLRRVSAEPGVHGGTLRGGTVVLVSRTPGRPGPRTMILPPPSGASATDPAGRGAGPAQRDPVVITSVAEAPVVQPRAELLSLGPRQLRAALFLPSWHDAGDGPLPVLMDPYGGPALRKVTAAQGWTTYVSQWFAEQGFAVLAVDGRGTPGRGPGWEREIYTDVAGPVLADQVDGLEHAARRFPALDLGRVAIRGWSFGGFLAVLAVLRRPDVFAAAVAGAPVTDQRLYDTHWRERHLGHPDEHPEAYDRCSPVLEAASLRRPLLLIHGLADDNVVPAHTLRLSAALLAAGRPHEVLPLPGATHLPVSEAATANLLLHELGFLRRALGLAQPPPR